MSGLAFAAKWLVTCAASLDYDTSLTYQADIPPIGTYTLVSFSSVEN
jgi:hypothetical protein